MYERHKCSLPQQTLHSRANRKETVEQFVLMYTELPKAFEQLLPHSEIHIFKN